MGRIVNPNGTPYTSAQDDLFLIELKKDFRDVLQREITTALRSSRTGAVNLRIDELQDFITRAYLRGRQDGA